MTYRIEKNVPIPMRGSPYPFAEMEVSDSVLVPESVGENARMAAHRHGKKFGKTFISRTVENGVRIWRTA